MRDRSVRGMSRVSSAPIFDEAAVEPRGARDPRNKPRRSTMNALSVAKANEGDPPRPARRAEEVLWTTDAHEALLRMCHDLVTSAVTIGQLATSMAVDPDLSDEMRRQLRLIAAEATAVSEICAFTLGAVRRPSRDADARGRASAESG